MNLKSAFQHIDIHSHLNFAAFDGDRNEVLSRAHTAGVAVITVGTQRDTSQKAVAIAEEHPEGVYAIVGLHPVHTSASFHDAKEIGPSFAKATEGKGGFTSRGEVFDYDYYKKLAMHPKVVGIGECGLDYYRLESGSEAKQRETFAAQIALANEAKKPLMLHVRSGGGRSAYRDALALLKKDAKVGGNFHFFAGSWDEAKKILDAGFSLSFTGVITFTHDYDEVVRETPLDRILSETDSPFVAPASFRGKRNEPLYVKEVVRTISRIKEREEEEVRTQILENARRLFGIAL